MVPGAGGGVRAIDEDGNTVFKGPAGQMWDSAGDQEAGPLPQLMSSSLTADPEAVQSSDQDASHPGKGDASAVLPVAVAADTVSVSPTQTLLQGAKTVYPVFIDPPMGLALQERTVLSSDGDRFWDA